MHKDALPVLPRHGFTYDPNAPVAVATLLTRTFTSSLQSWAPPQLKLFLMLHRMWPLISLRDHEHGTFC